MRRPSTPSGHRIEGDGHRDVGDPGVDNVDVRERQEQEPERLEEGLAAESRHRPTVIERVVGHRPGLEHLRRIEQVALIVVAHVQGVGHPGGPVDRGVQAEPGPVRNQQGRDRQGVDPAWAEGIRPGARRPRPERVRTRPRTTPTPIHPAIDPTEIACVRLSQPPTAMDRAIPRAIACPRSSQSEERRDGHPPSRQAGQQHEPPDERGQILESGHEWRSPGVGRGVGVRKRMIRSPAEDEWIGPSRLAIERELQHTITPEDAGEELREVSKEERPHLVLKEWESQDLIERVHPLLAKKHPSYDAINRLIKVRDDLFMAGYRPRLSAPMLLAILGKLKDRELGNLLSKLGFRSAEIDAIESFPDKVAVAEKELTGKKTNSPIDAYRFIEKLPVEYIAYILAESNKSAAVNKIKSFLHKWRPIRMALPVVSTELEALGMPRGPKFDQVVEEVFATQLNGRGKTPEERVKILRKLSGIKEIPKKKEKEKKPTKEEKAAAQATHDKHTAAIVAKSGAKGKPKPAPPAKKKSKK